MITLYGTVRTNEELLELQAEGDTYDNARAALFAQVPAGAQLLGISRWTC